MPIRVGLVGCGKIAQLMHLPFLEELEDFTIEHVCDVSPGTLAHVADRYHVAKRTTDFQTLVADPDLDAILVCTYDHGEVVRAALLAGKHVLVEKPLAFTVEEAEELVALATERNLVAMIGYMKNYDPGFEYGAELIRKIGKPKSITVHDFAGRFDKAGSLYSWAKVDDVPAEVFKAGEQSRLAAVEASLGDHAGLADLYMKLLMLGSHDLAAMRSLFGNPLGVSYARQVGDGQVTAVLDFPDGVPCVVEIGIGAKYEWWDQWIAVYGHTDMVRIEFSHPYVRYAPTVVIAKEAAGDAPCEKIIPVSNDEAFRREWLHFADCIRNGIAPRTPIAEGLEDLKLARSIIETITLTA